MGIPHQNNVWINKYLIKFTSFELIKNVWFKSVNYVEITLFLILNHFKMQVFMTF